ncbi:hypothetical protein ACLOJK_006555 [Asimina triloba]
MGKKKETSDDADMAAFDAILLKMKGSSLLVRIDAYDAASFGEDGAAIAERMKTWPTTFADDQYRLSLPLPSICYIERKPWLPSLVWIMEHRIGASAVHIF